MIRYSFVFFHIFLFLFNLYGDKKFTVIIDPGHGGNNKGAIYGEIEEKDLTLELALKIRAFVNKHGSSNIDVVFTRTQDIDFSLKNRVDLIEKTQPDLFISIHFNSQKLISTNRGFEIYYPPDVLGKNSVESALRYDRANRSFVYGNLLKELFFKTNLNTVWKLPFNLFTQKYGFFMFDETTVPGLLLEIAYLTSPDDRACIENPQFISDIAWFVYDFIAKIQQIGKGEEK